MSSNTETFSPATIKTLELGVVAGKVSVRSCSKSENISVTVRTYAATEDLLNTFNVQTTLDATNGVYRVVAQQPSFDFRHCQHSWIDVVIPEHAQVDLVAQAMLGSIEIEGDNEALKNVHVTSKVGRVLLRDLEATGAVTIESTLGYVSAKGVSAQGITTRQGVGCLKVYDVESPLLDSQLDIGSACGGNLDIAKVSFAAEFGYVGLWNVNATNVTAFVEYGKLSVNPIADFEGHFNAVSPYGFLDVASGSKAADVVYTTNNDAQVEGNIGTADASGVLRDVSLSSVYGAMNFFVPNPHTKWWKEHHEEKKD